MIQLSIDNSTSIVTGLNPTQEKELRKILSYKTDDRAAYFAGGFGPKEIPLINRKGEFPTGLLSKAVSYLKRFEYKSTDLRVCPKSTKNLFKMASHGDT